MNETNLDIKYLVLKISDINVKLRENEREKFWNLVKVIKADLAVKYLVLKISDINVKLRENEREKFWNLVKVIIT